VNVFIGDRRDSVMGMTLEQRDRDRNRLVPLRPIGRVVRKVGFLGSCAAVVVGLTASCSTSDSAADPEAPSTASEVPPEAGSNSQSESSSIPVSTQIAEASTSTSTAATPQSAYEPIYEAGPCPVTPPPDILVECGTVTVPEDRTRPEGRLIELAVARVTSPSTSGSDAPVVWLSGGPGGRSLRALAFPPDAGGVSSNPLYAEHDLIFVDQRGTGYSVPKLDCPGYEEAVWSVLGMNSPFADELDVIHSSLAVCRDDLERQGVDLSQYDTVANAADFADIRAALGIATWSIRATSYGTLIAQELMRSHPEGVSAVLLDSVVPVDKSRLDEQDVPVDMALERLFTACEESVDCNTAFPDLRNRWTTMLRNYDENPLAASVSDDAGALHDIVITGGEIRSGIASAMYSSDLLGSIPVFIELAEQRAPQVQDAFANAQNQLFAMAEGMRDAVNCRDRLHDITIEQVTQAVEARPELAFGHLIGSQANCQVWAVGAVDESFAELVRSDIPTLVLAGTYDPVTPPIDGARVAALLPNSTFVEFDATGHGVFRSNPCADRLVTQFFAAPTDPLDTTCVDSIGPLVFAS
jgi:pimeloyl-ACP methyl ester carboxylesterase